MTAEEIIKTLGLAPHPEGGFFRETWRAEGSGRAAGTAIYYLLRGQDRHRWHTVDSAEIWHFYAGAPLVLSIAETDAGPATDHNLGLDLNAGAVPQVIVPPGHWQVARCTGEWTLVGCTVSPGFEFEHFTLAPEDFDIPR
ncbi:MAG: cupin domain-containing protein [Pseudomonadota bacterium]